MPQSFKVNETFCGGGLLPTLCKEASFGSSELTKVKNGFAVLYTLSQSYFFIQDKQISHSQ